MCTLARIDECGPEKSSFLVYFTRRESEDLNRDFVCMVYNERQRRHRKRLSIHP